MPFRGSGWSPRRYAPVIGVALLLLVGVWLPALGPAPTGRSDGPGARIAVTAAGSSPWVWDNGLVRLVFPNPIPSFSIVSDRNASLSTSHILTGIAEVTPSGNSTAWAPFNQIGAGWVFSSVHNSSTTTVWMNASLRVVGAGGSWESPDELAGSEGESGTTHVVLSFFLNSSSATDPASVRFAVSDTQWPWVSPTDSIGFGFVDVAVPGATIRPGAASNSLLEVRTGDNATLSTLTWASRATVYYGSGTQGTSAVGTYQAIAPNGANSTVHLEFGAVTGGYSDLSFDPWIQLNLSALSGPLPLPAWLWTPESLAVLGLAGVLTIALGVTAIRSRSRSSSPP